MKKFGRTYRIRNKKKNSQQSDDKHLTNRLLVWIRINGFLMKKMKCVLFHDSGRGLKSYEVINPGDLLIAVPYNFLITCDTVSKSYLREIITNYHPCLSVMEIISVFLMCEKLRGKSSYWYFYIQSLPLEYILPAYFPQECFKYLPSSIFYQVQKKKILMEKTYNKLKKLLKTIENQFLQFQELLTFTFFQWAWFIVNTRCVYMECKQTGCCISNGKQHLALVPFLDLLNHSPNVQVKAGFNDETNCYEIIHLNKIKKFQQIFINYGPHTNATLFNEYGFIIPNNSNDDVLFDWDTVKNTSTLFESSSYLQIEEKMTILHHHKLLSDLTCSREGLSWNFEMVLRILSASSCTRSYIEQIIFNGAFSPDDDALYRRIALHLLNAKIQELSYNTEENLSGFTSSYIKLINQFCSETKCLLLECMNKI